MSGRQLLEWKAYSEIEPFGEERADLRLAAILRMLYAINRDSSKSPDLPSLGDFYGNFLSDVESTIKPSQGAGIAKHQTWQQQKAILLEFAVQQAVFEQKRLQRAKK